MHSTADPLARAISRRAALTSIAVAAGAPLFAGDPAAPPADLVVLNAKITTMDPARPEATALAVRGKHFVAVGDARLVQPLVGPFTTVIDARGKRLIPGLIDSHTHSIRGGVNYTLEVRWDAADSLEEGLHMLRQQATVTPAGQFIRVAGGFSEFQFKEKRLPTRSELDAVAPDHPVLIHYLYKKTILNSRAISFFGYDKPGHPTYPGGIIGKDQDGNPTGELLAAPSGLLMYKTLSRAPKLSVRDQINSSLQYMDELNSLGLTSVSDAGGGGMFFPDGTPYQVIRYLHRENLLSTRIGYHAFPQIKGQEFSDYQQLVKSFKTGQGDDMFKFIGAGENLAWSSYDYEIFGDKRPDIEDGAEAYQQKIMTLLGEHGMPFRQHITYDETGDRLLKVYEEVARGAGLAKGWFIDHVETFQERNLERIATLGGGIALQNRLQFQAEDFIANYGTEALKKTPNFRFILDLGVPVGGGTDATRVTSYNPWYSIQWMCTGLSRGGLRMYDDTNLLSRHEALQIWTTGSAWFTGDAGRKGAITTGQLADFAILDQDFFSITDAEIAKLGAVLTVLDGEVVYARDRWAHHDLRHVPPVMPSWSPVRTFGDKRS